MIKDWEKNIEVDLCLEHGIWLDRGELERIVGRSSGAQVRHRRAQDLELDNAYGDGKWQGIWLGLLALFLKRR